MCGSRTYGRPAGLGRPELGRGEGVAEAAGADGAGHARYTFRLRVPSTAHALLAAEWDRCRWVWNECVAKSKQVHAWNKNRPEGTDKRTCGPAQLDKMLTDARARTPWVREGSSVPQQQLIRDFGKSKAKAQKDIRDRVPQHRRAGMPQWKKKRETLPTLNYTRRGFRLKDGKLHLAGGIALTVVWSRDLPADPSSVRVYQDSLGHWYASFVVPAEVQPLPETGRVIGIDWGVKETATATSDAHDLAHARHGRKAKEKLTRYDRMMARRKPKRGEGRVEGLPHSEETSGQGAPEGRPAAPGHGPQVGQVCRPRPRRPGRRGLQIEVSCQDHHGQEGRRRRHRRDQTGPDRDGP